MTRWKMVPLGEVARPKQWPTLTKAQLSEDGYPVYGANGPIGRYRDYTHEQPTILIGCRGSCGTVHVTPPQAYANGNAMALDAVDMKVVDINFLAKFFRWRGLADVTTGTSQPQIIAENLRTVLVPTPPLPEQNRIAAILDKADALRTKRREALDQLDRLAQSIFIDMFGDPATNPKRWPIVRIGDLLESASYGTSEKSGTAGRFPVLRMNNITRTGDMDFTDMKYMDLDESEHDRYLVKEGDVLFNRTNSAELVGKTAIFRQATPMAYAGYLIRLRTGAGNDPEYLAAFMNTAYTKRVLRNMCKSIIGMANINATEVQSIRIAQPPLAVQVQFGQRIRYLNRAKAMHQVMQAELDGFFSSLQHRAFRGEL